MTTRTSTTTRTTTHTPTMLAVVESMSRAGTDVLLIELAPADPDATFPAFTAGAHVDLHLGPVIRQYSLLGDPTAPDATTRWFIAVKHDHDGRGGSTVIHEQLRVGHILEITGPRNHFPLEDTPGRVVLLAGGIGITPLAAMAAACDAVGRPRELHVYASTAEDVPLRGHVSGAVEHLSVDGDSVRTATGLPTGYIPGDQLYICGPGGFIDRAVELAAADGWPEEAVRVERFAPSAASAAASATDGAFEVRLASTGATFPVPEDMSIADVLTDNGVDIELSCEAGMCGACLTGVVDGVPDHRDDVQSPTEHASNTQITLCCSRSLTPSLTLDL
ncbi:PDR/VanB family oxidoreductase [Corynebacterium terpenotabidum]|uniref:Vanillate O-demethylase oxidoreductase n=1 Tax=Corynebacterium terpenotabidum Y-11 TaxID=1200352 RepID=S4XMI8_9CORY|nr:PDR/VanB family oxidoreductase [Corynebacterium terpenotabidum]AGP31868.1 vanillate O-demethylase oxidoreductase [Corynebacterium terpenotabidum Y-11]